MYTPPVKLVLIGGRQCVVTTGPVLISTFFKGDLLITDFTSIRKLNEESRFFYFFVVFTDLKFSTKKMNMVPVARVKFC